MTQDVTMLTFISKTTISALGAAIGSKIVHELKDPIVSAVNSTVDSVGEYTGFWSTSYKSNSNPKGHRKHSYKCDRKPITQQQFDFIQSRFKSNSTSENKKTQLHLTNELNDTLGIQKSTAWYQSIYKDNFKGKIKNAD